MIDARPWGRSIEQDTRLPNSVIEPATEIERSSPAPPPISLETPLRDNGLLGKPGGPALYLGVCKVMFALMVYAGLRRIEVTQLKWSDIERSSYRASDRVSNETLEGDVIVVRSGKGGKHRIIPICDKLGTVLDGWSPKGEYVVCSKRGQKVTVGELTRSSRKYVLRLDHHYKGKLRLSLHSLRATFITGLARKNVPPFTIQKLAGHSDIRVTLKYVQVTEEDLRAAVRLL